MTGDLPSISSTTIRAEAGPVEIPQAPCPAQMNRPGISAMRPMSGRPSMLCGRAHARVPRMGASVDGRDERARPGEDPLDPVRRFRFARQERRPDRGDPVERHQAEMDAAVRRRPPRSSRCRSPRRSRPPPGCGPGRSAARSRRRRPSAADRRHAPVGSIDAPATRPGRHEDRVRRCRDAIHDDPDDRRRRAGRGRLSGPAAPGRRVARRSSRRHRSRRPARPGSRSRPGSPRCRARSPVRSPGARCHRPRHARARGTPRPATGRRRGRRPRPRTRR